MGYQKIVAPDQGEKITVNDDLSLNVPDQLTCRSSRVTALAWILRR